MGKRRAMCTSFTIPYRYPATLCLIMTASIILAAIRLTSLQPGTDTALQEHVAISKTPEDRQLSVMATRRRHITEVCSSHNWSRGLDGSRRKDYWRLLVDDPHEVVYCVIPKAACSSFKSYMANATKPKRQLQKMPVHSARFLSSLGLRYMVQRSAGNIEKKLRNYHTYIVVRHPFDRLISAYEDKFVRGIYYAKHYGPIFEKLFKSQVKYDSIGIVRPTLSQFLEAVARLYPLGFRDRHWQTYYDLCHPCDIRYDSVIKLETFNDDITTFTERYDESNKTFPNLNEVSAARTTEKLAETSRRLATMDKKIMTKLMHVYEKDFELFGYSWNVNHGAGCGSERGGHLHGC